MFNDIKIITLEVVKYTKLNKENCNKDNKTTETEETEQDYGRMSYESNFMFWNKNDDKRNSVTMSNETTMANHSNH